MSIETDYVDLRPTRATTVYGRPTTHFLNMHLARIARGPAVCGRMIGGNFSTTELARVRCLLCLLKDPRITSARSPARAIRRRHLQRRCEARSVDGISVETGAHGHQCHHRAGHRGRHGAFGHFGGVLSWSDAEPWCVVVGPEL